MGKVIFFSEYIFNSSEHNFMCCYLNIKVIRKWRELSLCILFQEILYMDKAIHISLQLNNMQIETF